MTHKKEIPSKPPVSSAKIADDIAALEASLKIDFQAFDEELSALARNPGPPRAVAAKDVLAAVPPPVVSVFTHGPEALKGAPPIKPAVPTPAPVVAPVPTPAPAAAPERMPVRAAVKPGAPAAPAVDVAKASQSPTTGGGSLLDMLRQQAVSKQQEEAQEKAKRNAFGAEVDKALKRIFSYLNELSQQLNIVKPPIARQYVLQESIMLADLLWHEGSADYRSQSQSANALVETVNCSWQLKGRKTLIFSRDGANYERMRTLLFDYGLPFSCEEVRNAKRQVERAEFIVRNEINVSLRWQADFDKGEIVVETRNLERFGPMRYTIPYQAVDQPLLEAFGRLMLGQPNNFRELMRRQ